MPETAASVTELTSHYANQVAGDLEQNVKEQQRITAEIASLQEQLATLQRDHTVLMNMQQALGVAPSAGTATAEPESPVVPSPRKKSAAEPGKRRTGKAATGGQSGTGKRSTKKAVAEPAAAKSASPAAQPTLVELVRGHLAVQSEPRSAAEVAEALGKAHPGREIQTKVVRTTLENLVARNSAQRTKQGSSVFYTVPSAPGPTAASEDRAEPAAG